MAEFLPLEVQQNKLLLLKPVSLRLIVMANVASDTFANTGLAKKSVMFYFSVK